MKTTRFVIVACFLFLTLARASPETTLRGCSSPGQLATKLAQVQANDWTTVSVERIQSLWPGRFDELVCESTKGCRLLVSKERVIKGHCECCVAFRFGLEQNTDGTKLETLEDVIIHYSNPSKANVFETAKILARASGLSETAAASFGDELIQRHNFKALHGKLEDNYILEIQITQVHGNWELYLSLGSEPR